MLSPSTLPFPTTVHPVSATRYSLTVDTPPDFTSWAACFLSSEAPRASTSAFLRPEGGADRTKCSKERSVLYSQRQQMYKGKPSGRFLRGASGVSVFPEAWTWVGLSWTPGCSKRQHAEELCSRLVCTVRSTVPWGSASYYQSCL